MSNEEQIKAAAVEDVAKAQNRVGRCPEALRQVMEAGWKPVHIEAGVGEFSWNCTIHATSTVNDMMVDLRADVDAQGTIRDESGDRVFWVMVDACADDARWKTIVRDDYSTPSPEEVVKLTKAAEEAREAAANATVFPNSEELIRTLLEKGWLTMLSARDFTTLIASPEELWDADEEVALHIHPASWSGGAGPPEERGFVIVDMREQAGEAARIRVSEIPTPKQAVRLLKAAGY